MSFPAPIRPEKFQIGGSSPSGLGQVHTPEGQRPGSTPGSYEIPGLGVQSTGGFYTESFKDFKGYEPNKEPSGAENPVVAIVRNITDTIMAKYEKTNGAATVRGADLKFLTKLKHESGDGILTKIRTTQWWVTSATDEIMAMFPERGAVEMVEQVVAHAKRQHLGLCRARGCHEYQPLDWPSEWEAMERRMRPLVRDAVPQSVREQAAEEMESAKMDGYIYLALGAAFRGYVSERRKLNGELLARKTIKTMQALSREALRLKRDLTTTVALGVQIPDYSLIVESMRKATKDLEARNPDFKFAHRFFAMSEGLHKLELDDARKVHEYLATISRLSNEYTVEREEEMPAKNDEHKNKPLRAANQAVADKEQGKGQPDFGNAL